MLKRTLAVVAAAALVSIAVAPAVLASAAETATHRGEIIAIDSQNSKLTVRILADDGSGKETHVYNVDQKTTIKDKATGKDMKFSDLKVGDKIQVKSTHEGGGRQALEIWLRPIAKVKKP